MTAAAHLRTLGACLVAMVAASGASALDAVSPSAPGTQSAEAAAIGSAASEFKAGAFRPANGAIHGRCECRGRSRLLRVLDGGAAGQPQPAGSHGEAARTGGTTPKSGIPIPPMAASVIAGCPRDLLTRLLAGVAERQDALSALAIEHETLKLCHERQLIVTGIFETEAQLRALRAPAEPAAANRSPAVAATVPSVMPQLNTVPAKLPAPSTTARKPAKAAPAAPRYGWFSILGMAGDLRAGVTDGRRVWFVREGDPLPGDVRVGRIAARPPGVQIEGSGTISALPYQGAGPETAHDPATGKHPSRHHRQDHGQGLRAVFCPARQAQRQRGDGDPGCQPIAPRPRDGRPVPAHLRGVRRRAVPDRAWL